MQSRDAVDVKPAAFGNLVLRTAPNWTVVGFLAMLGSVHLTIAVTTFVSGRWESYLSLAFGLIFLSVATLFTQFRYELAVFPTARRIRLRHGIGHRFCIERFVPFRAITGIRLTLAHG